MKNLDDYFLFFAYPLEKAGRRILLLNRTKTDTSGWVEHTKALERTMLKELGKITL